ncbi:hypothetical protein [Rubrobacter marinus]|nr:hypothetical protein [Rubrobacter marinus]
MLLDDLGFATVAASVAVSKHTVTENCLCKMIVASSAADFVRGFAVLPV